MPAKLPTPKEARRLTRRLLAWYDGAKRVLPWRATTGAPDPYRVWLSEIMLQQTTVAAVAPRFEAFLKRWSTVEALAEAKLDDVLHEWQGLGYYARARNLHACAQIVARELDGRFPGTKEGLLALPGIGPYTAGAIAAIAFNQAEAAVDGNVERVIARLFRVTASLPGSRPKLRALAQALAPSDRPGDFAQAMMDLGATVCTPRSPRCGSCPWRKRCAAHAAGGEDRLPAKTAKAKRPVKRTIAFWLMRDDGAVLLRRRPDKGLLAGMDEIPSAPWRGAPWTLEEAVAQGAPAEARWRLLPGTVAHVFTHLRLEAQVAIGRLAPRGAEAEPLGLWTRPEDFARRALPTAMKKIAAHAMRAGGEALHRNAVAEINAT